LSAYAVLFVCWGGLAFYEGFVGFFHPLTGQARFSFWVVLVLGVEERLSFFGCGRACFLNKFVIPCWVPWVPAFFVITDGTLALCLKFRRVKPVTRGQPLWSIRQAKALPSGGRFLLLLCFLALEPTV